MRENVIICDRCGKEIVRSNRRITENNCAQIKIFGPHKPRTNPDSFDLCEECYEDFINWWESGQ